MLLDKEQDAHCYSDPDHTLYSRKRLGWIEEGIDAEPITEMWSTRKKEHVMMLEEREPTNGFVRASLCR